MKKSLLNPAGLSCLFSLFIFSNSLVAQAPSYSWANGIGSTGDDRGIRMTTDASGNTYTAGSFTGTVDFDPDGVDVFNLTSQGGTDIFVCKLDATGDFVWAVNMGGTGDDAGQAVAVDASGNVYITGVFRNTADFNLASPGVNTLTSAGMADFFACKLNSSGSYAWVTGTGSVNDDAGNSIVLDGSGNVHVAGNFGATTTVDFDPDGDVDALTSFGQSDDFVWKLDNNGNHIFVKQMGCVTNDLCNGIALDASGNIYLTGSFNATADFDPDPVDVFNLSNSGSNDIFLCKLDATGDFQWAHKMGSTGTDIGNSVLVDNAGAVVFTGNFSNTVNFDPLGTAPGLVSSTLTGLDVFICKFDAAGNFTWVKSFTGTGLDRSAGLHVDAGNNIYNSGNFAGTNDFDPSGGTFNITNIGLGDIYVVSLTAAGDFNWAFSIGSSGDDSGQSVRYVGGNIYLGGRFSTTADFDPDGVGVANLTSAGSTDMFVAKFAGPVCTPTSSNLTITSCDDYTLNSTTYTISGMYTQTVTNVAGCDSTINLDLTINQSTSGTITATSCDDYTLNSTTYTISGTYTQTLTNTAGCDSTITLNLTINESTGSTITTTACDSYTLNSTTYTSSNTYTQTLTNVAGCDSIITLNLTIDPLVNTGVTTAGTTITAAATGATYQWIDCGTLLPIAGETGQSYTATSNGSYAVIITDGTCSDTSACTTYSNIGISEVSQTALIQLSPNPAVHHVTLTTMQYGACTLVDMTGKTVLNVEVNQGKNDIDISGLNQGVYLVKLDGEATGLRLVKL